MGSITLHANENRILPETMLACDLGGKGLFDLEQQKNTIKTELNLPSDVRLFCYSKEEDASLGQNSLENHTLRFQNTFLLEQKMTKVVMGRDNLT
jgi:hypothetical protein